LATFSEFSVFANLSEAAGAAAPYVAHFATFPKLTGADIVNTVRSMGFHISNQTAYDIIRHTRITRQGDNIINSLPGDRIIPPELVPPAKYPTLRNYTYRVKVQLRNIDTGRFAGQKWITIHSDTSLSRDEAADRALDIFAANSPVYKTRASEGLQVEARRNPLNPPA